MPEIKAIAFDIDGTLYPQWRLLTTSLGFYLCNFQLVQNYWRVRNNLREDSYYYEAEGRQGLLRHQAEMCAELGRGDPLELVELLNQKVYHSWEKTFRWIRPLPGVHKVFQELKRRGFRVAVMSDFPVERKLQYFGLEPERHWDLAITSEDSGYLKPHAIAYEYLAAQLGLPAAQILYVGNSYRNDILGAKDAGCWAAYFTWKGHKNSRADFHYHNYHQFLGRFEKFLENS